MTKKKKGFYLPIAKVIVGTVRFCNRVDLIALDIWTSSTDEVKPTPTLYLLMCCVVNLPIVLTERIRQFGFQEAEQRGLICLYYRHYRHYLQKILELLRLGLRKGNE